VITIICHPCFGSFFSITRSLLLSLNSNFFDNTSIVLFNNVVYYATVSWLSTPLSIPIAMWDQILEINHAFD